jgi:hypothetical protein
MANVTVYFATNRIPQGLTTDWHSYGADIIPPTDPSQIIYAEAFVQGTDLAVEGSGTITAISHPQTGGFETGVAQDIVGSGKNILVFIHGFANSFLNSIARAAYNREWFAASGANAADTTVIAFFGSAVRRAAAPSPGRLSARPGSGRPLGLPHRELSREPSADADAVAQPGEAGFSTRPQHGQFRIGGCGRKLVQPQ